MTETQAHRCPICGGPTAPDKERCDYCSSPLLTVRCGGCFKLNSPESLHCSGCGRELGLEPLDLGQDLTCPDCRIRFQVFGSGTGYLRECTRCGGQFVEHELLRDLLERRAVHRPLGRLPLPQNPLEDEVRYRPCPACQALMNRRNFGDTSGIVVDVCSLHGVWFDAGELPLVLRFVSAGGLERARIERARPSGTSFSPISLSSPEAPFATGIADAGLMLIDLVLDCLAKLKRPG